MNALRALDEIPSAQRHLKGAIASLYMGETRLAEEILVSASLFAELNTLFQSSGQWTRALSLTESKDRIHMNNTFYKFGMNLANSGDISGAIAILEKTGKECG